MQHAGKVRLCIFCCYLTQAMCNFQELRQAVPLETQKSLPEAPSGQATCNGLFPWLEHDGFACWGPSNVKDSACHLVDSNGAIAVHLASLISKGFFWLSGPPANLAVLATNHGCFRLGSMLPPQREAFREAPSEDGSACKTQAAAHSAHAGCCRGHGPKSLPTFCPLREEQHSTSKGGFKV